jgi:hypothetical protein
VTRGLSLPKQFDVPQSHRGGEEAQLHSLFNLSTRKGGMLMPRTVALTKDRHPVPKVQENEGPRSGQGVCR